MLEAARVGLASRARVHAEPKLIEPVDEDALRAGERMT